MSYIHSFPPLISEQSRIIILGSIPGKASLKAQQYYAHPRNAFWPIVGRILDIDFTAPYQERCHLIVQSPIAVWDTLKACTRESSLDSDIEESSIVPNDFNALFTRHPNVRAIFFNGAKSEQAFKKYALSTLTVEKQNIPLKKLPSTSPAYAAMRFEEKLKNWQTGISKYLC